MRYKLIPVIGVLQEKIIEQIGFQAAFIFSWHSFYYICSITYQILLKLIYIFYSIFTSPSILQIKINITNLHYMLFIFQLSPHFSLGIAIYNLIHIFIFYIKNRSMYEELKRKIQQEKLNLQQELQKINNIKNTPKVYTVYQKPSQKVTSSSIPKNSQERPQAQTNQIDTVNVQQVTSTPNKSNHSIKQELSSNQHISQQTCIDQYREQIESLKGIIKQKERDISELNKKYEQLEHKSKDEYSKVSDEQKRLKEMVMELTKKQQNHDEQVTKLEQENYELLVKYEQMSKIIQKKDLQNHKLSEKYETIKSFLKQFGKRIRKENQQFESKCFQLSIQTGLLGKQSSDQQQSLTQKSISYELNSIKEMLERISICGKVIHESLLSFKKNVNKQVKENDWPMLIDHKNEEIRRLEDYINELTSQKNNLTKQLQKQKKKYQQRSSAQKYVKDQLSKTIKNHEEKIYKLQQTNEDIQKQSENYEKRVNQLKQIIEKGNKNLQEEQKKSLQIEKQLQEVNKELKQKLENIQVDLQVKLHEIKQLKERQQISIKNNQNSAESNVKIEALTKQNQKIKIVLEDLLKELQGAKQEGKTLIQVKQKLEQQYNALKQENILLKKLNNNENKEVDEAKSKLVKQCDKLREQNKQMSQKIKETEKIKASLKDDLFNYYLMSKDYNDLKIQYQQLKKQRQHNEDQYSEDKNPAKNKEQIQTLKIENKDMNDYIKKLELHNQQLRQQLRDFSEAQAQNIELNRHSQYLKEQNNKLFNQVKELEKNLKQIKYESESQIKDIEPNQEEKRLKEENQILINKIKQFEENEIQQLKLYAQNQIKIVQLQKQYSDVKEQNGKLTSQVLQFEKQMSKLNQKLKQHSNYRQKEAKNIQQLLFLKEANNRLTNEIERLTQQLRQYQKSKRQSVILEENYQQLSKQKITLKEEVSYLNKQIQQFKFNINQFEKIVGDSVANEARYRNIQTQSKKKDLVIQLQQGELIKVKQQLIKVKQQLNILKEKQSRGQNQSIRKLKTKVQELKQELVSKEKQINDKDLYINSVKEQNLILQKNIDYLNQKAETVIHLKKSSSHYEAKNSQLEEQLEQKEKQLEVKENELKKIDEEILALKKENSQLKQNFQSLEVKIKTKSASDIGYSSPNKNSHNQKNSNLSGILGRIRINCLKNNCDSVGIINIQFEKILTDAHIITSPTDLEKFNNKDQNDDIDSFDLQRQDSKDIRSPSNVPSQSDSDSKENVNTSKKGSLQIPFVNKTLPDADKSKQIVEERIKSSQRVYKQNKKQTSERQLVSADSLENNPDQSFEPLPYPLLMQKYENLQSNYDKMQDYVNKVEENIKLKKTIEEVDQYAHYTVIDQIAERFSKLVRQSDRKRDSGDFAFELGKIVEELKNYIHFVESLTKLDSINKAGKAFNPIRMDRNNNRKPKEKDLRKVLSEGDFHEDYQYDHIEAGNIYEHQGGYHAEQPKIDRSQKRIPKQQQQYHKQKDEKFKNYFENKRQGYSEISSVKNKSLQSHDSFFNSRSQFGQLGHYFRMKMNQINEQNKQEDSEKLSQMSLNEIRQKYKKLKESNKFLESTKQMLEKACNEFENQQKEYQRKIAKMTRQFNESFGMLCKISGGQIKPRGSSLAQPQKNQCQVQTGSNLELPYLKEEKKGKEKEQNDSIEQSKKVEELMTINKKLTNDIKVIEQRHKQILIRIKQKIIEPLMEVLKKNNFDFASFMKKMTDKIPQEAIRRIVSADSELDKKIFKRKESQSYFEIQTIKEADEPNLDYSQMLIIVSNILNIDHNELKKKITTDQLQQFLQQKVQELKKNQSIDYLSTINDNLIKFNALQSSQQRKAKLEQHKQDLLNYFENNQQINELMLSIKDLISVIRRDNSNAVSHLSVNSKQDGNFKYHDEDDYQSDQAANKKKFKEIQQLKDELEEINRQLNNEVDQLRKALNRKNNRTPELKQEQSKFQEAESNEQSIKIRDLQIQGLQKQRAMLEDELMRVKESQARKKKSKIYFINH